MADTLLSGVAADTVIGGSEQIYVNDAGVDKKITPLMLQEFMSDKGVDVASASIVALPAGEFFHITGSVTITDIDFVDTWDGRRARVVFDAAPLLTNSASLLLPGRANIQAGPGDSATFVVDSGDNVICMQFERASQTQSSNPSNTSIANQTPAASATTLLTDSLIPIPGHGVQIRSRFLWHVQMSKTAAGTVAPIILVKIGTAGTTADGTVLTFTFPSVGTAVADIADLWIEMQIVSLGAAAVVRGQMIINRELGATATGWLSAANTMKRVIGTPATFNSTVASLKASLALTLGASYVVTVETVSVETQGL